MLQNLFVSEVRIKILKLLVLNPESSFHVRAIVREVGTEINAVRRELENLSSINLVRSRQSSNRIYYTVDTGHVLYSDLVSLLSKETGLGKSVLSNQKQLGNIKFAVLSKAFLKGRLTSVLEVDLFIVGDIKMEALEKMIKDYQVSTGKEINYSAMTENEFRQRKRSNDHFVIRFMMQSRSMLVGDEEEFCSMM